MQGYQSSQVLIKLVIVCRLCIASVSVHGEVGSAVRLRRRAAGLCRALCLCAIIDRSWWWSSGPDLGLGTLPCPAEGRRREYSTKPCTRPSSSSPSCWLGLAIPVYHHSMAMAMAMAMPMQRKYVHACFTPGPRCHTHAAQNANATRAGTSSPSHSAMHSFLAERPSFSSALVLLQTKQNKQKQGSALVAFVILLRCFGYPSNCEQL